MCIRDSQDPRQIAAAAPIKTSAAQSNSGTGKISAGAALDASDPNLLSATSIQFPLSLIHIYALETAPASSDPRKLDIRFKQTSAIVTDFLNGGEIGGLVAFQKQVLDPAQNKLGLMAAGLAETVNDQHRLGMDLNNQLGTDFFKVGGPKIANNTNNSDYTTYNADGNALSVSMLLPL